MSFFKSIWHKFLGGKKTPWADIKYVNGRMSVEDYNQAFTDDLRDKFSNIIDETHNDSDVVKLFIDRENIEHEEPKLDVKHSGIMEDGRIKMELDWNTAFIRHLAANGITGETEEEAIRIYLAMLSAENSDGILGFTEGEIDEAFHEQDLVLAAEFDEAKYQIEKEKAKRRSYKSRRST